MNKMIKNIQKYEIKSAKIESMKQLNLVETIAANDNTDDDLAVSGYDIPPQSVNNSSNELQTDVNDSVS